MSDTSLPSDSANALLSRSENCNRWKLSAHKHTINVEIGRHWHNDSTRAQKAWKSSYITTRPHLITLETQWASSSGVFQIRSAEDKPILRLKNCILDKARTIKTTRSCAELTLTKYYWSSAIKEHWTLISWFGLCMHSRTSSMIRPATNVIC